MPEAPRRKLAAIMFTDLVGYSALRQKDEALALELTENVLLENSIVAENMVKDLKTLGIELHLDDFGTGFSSLSYLHRAIG